MTFMAKKQIREVTIVDVNTGEEVNRKVMYSEKYTESFIMLRTTIGIDWYFELTNNEKNLVLMLHDWANHLNMRLSLSGWQREMIIEKLGIKRRMLSILIRGLESKDCLLRLGQNDFMLNPEHAFKCSTGEVKTKIGEYREIKAKLIL